MMRLDYSKMAVGWLPCRCLNNNKDQTLAEKVNKKCFRDLTPWDAELYVRPEKKTTFTGYIMR